MISFLETADDMKWLKEVHGIDAKFAMLYGNEDAPTKVEVFTENHIDMMESIWLPDESGKLVDTPMRLVVKVIMDRKTWVTEINGPLSQVLEYFSQDGFVDDDEKPMVFKSVSLIRVLTP